MVAVTTVVAIPVVAVEASEVEAAHPVADVAVINALSKTMQQ